MKYVKAWPPSMLRSSMNDSKRRDLGGNKMKRAVAVLGIIAGSLLTGMPAHAENNTSGKRIALSNFYAGNSWRQSMLQAWTDSANEAIKAGIIKETKIVNANNSATEQASQIESLIVEGWDAIVVDPISTTAINGAIQDACDAGITVVVFNESATAPCAKHIITNYVSVGAQQAEFFGKTLKGSNNILEIRGIAGTSADDDMHKGLVDGLKNYPNLKIVGAVNGNWTGTITQREVAGILPSLPEVNAVATQGGDGFGAYQAFKAANRPTPVIIMGHRQDELALWKQLLGTDPSYNTFSISSTPGGSKAAFWVAQQLLAGMDVPSPIDLPLPVIQKADLEGWLKVMPAGSVVVTPYTQAWVKEWIENARNGKPAPHDPKPSM
jgi:ribose transport system substrate-binding protein